MKITKEHFQIISEKCAEVVAQYPTAAEDYKNSGVSATRYRWDVARKAGLIQFFCDVIYKYANDDHIETALKKAMPCVEFEYQKARK